MSEPECLNPSTTMNKWNLKAGSSGILLEIQQEQQITCFSKVIDMSLSQSQTRTKPSFRFLGPSVTKKSENVYEDKSAILVGGWNKPSEKYAHQIGAFPQVGVKITNNWNHHLESYFLTIIFSRVLCVCVWHDVLETKMFFQTSHPRKPTSETTFEMYHTKFGMLASTHLKIWVRMTNLPPNWRDNLKRNETTKLYGGLTFVAQGCWGKVGLVFNPTYKFERNIFRLSVFSNSFL